MKADSRTGSAPSDAVPDRHLRLPAVPGTDIPSDSGCWVRGQNNRSPGIPHTKLPSVPGIAPRCFHNFPPAPRSAGFHPVSGSSSPGNAESDGMLQDRQAGLPDSPQRASTTDPYIVLWRGYIPPGWRRQTHSAPRGPQSGRHTLCGCRAKPPY